MITKIVMDKITSYKKPVIIETDKKVNIIYGLNGTGKTTISDFLYNRNDQKYSSCSVQMPGNELLLVYNTSFIQDNFYKKPNQDGIFTLSKENKLAEENIRKARDQLSNLETTKKEKEEKFKSLSKNRAVQKEEAATKTWKIKTEYTGGDRVLEYCLDRLKGNKETLFEYLCQVDQPKILPLKTIDELKKEATLLNENAGNKYNLLSKIKIDPREIEQDDIFSKIIVGNEDSAFAALITQLDNADWVKSGLQFLHDNDIDENPAKCPFCQQETITKKILLDIQNYFNEEYEKEISKIKQYYSEYSNFISNLKKETYTDNIFIDDMKLEFETRINSVINCLEKNIKKISDKLNLPSQTFTLDTSYQLLLDFNDFIDTINKKVYDYNLKIDNKQKSLDDIKILFWSVMRYNYDSIINSFLSDDNDFQKKIEALMLELQTIDSEIKKQMDIIKAEQKKTVNIDEAIENINNNLLVLGIDSFKVSKYQENFYTITRDSQQGDAFFTLSEGEKMIISFLYFLELCKGKKDAEETISKKIVIIDDPISSLSHVYIYNIGWLIKREFFQSSQIEQIFILTHSLYFFYEMTFIKKDKREKEQKLFRIVKNSNGSLISEMKYEEIQNDYQSYWSIINNPDHPAAIQANCMRNIIEYFFGFIEMKDLNNIFQKPVFQDAKFQGFNRYINRESHSIGQNIFDYKEFNYDVFSEALKELFYAAGYGDHYERMSKIR